MTNITYDIVLQGPVYPETAEIINSYISLPFVNKIILSTWDNQPYCTVDHHRLVEIRSSDLLNPGPGNINRQIKSSALGLEQVSTEFSIKMRTDQIISVDSMEKMHDYFLKNRGSDLSILYGREPIFVLGMYRNFVFHPRDHVFWGRTCDLKELFNIPYYNFPEPNLPKGSDPYWSNIIRPETWIGAHYYSKLCPKIEWMIEDPEHYLLDVSPNKELALFFDNEIRNDVFRPFPKIKMRWPKHGLEDYHYDVGARLSEYWAD